MMQGDEEDVMDEVSLVMSQHCSLSPQSAAPVVTTNQSQTCRSLRWYQRLLVLRKGQMEQEVFPFSNAVLRYEQLQEQYSSLIRQLEENKDGNEKTSEVASELNMTKTASDESDSTLLSLDPLSAMLREDDAKVNRQKEIEQLYERDRRRNKGRRGPYIPDESEIGDTTANATAYKQLINKDLLRLSSPHQKHYQETSAGASSTCRLDQLRYILYLFAISHPEAGYLQGMHEIASFCLYTLEIEEEALQEHQHYAHKAALSYWLTESIITSLYIAYDVTSVSSTDTSDNIKIVKQPYQPTPLVQMSNRILQSLSLLDTTLYSILYSSSQAIPYQLIFTKWIRLLFSREVVACSTMTHADTVIFLWDELFDASYKLSQLTSSTNSDVPLLQLVAELFCVARLWHHTNTIQHLQYCSRAAENNFLLHWLMNISSESIFEVRSILIRLNYIIAVQFNNNISSDTIKAQQLLLPPLNAISPDVLAMTQPPATRNYQVETSQKQQNSHNNHHLWECNSNVVGSSFFQAAAAAIASHKDHTKALSSFTETVASKTQSIQKLIAQEWENVQAQLIDNPRHDSDSKVAATDHFFAASQLFPAQQRGQHQEQSKYNLDYYSSNTFNPIAVSEHEPDKVKWSEQLQRNLNTIHEYVAAKEQEPLYPGAGVDTRCNQNRLIWDALAELQLLQQQMLRNGL